MTDEQTDVVTISCNGETIKVPLEALKQIVLAGKIKLARFLIDPVQITIGDDSNFQDVADFLAGRAQAYQRNVDALGEAERLIGWANQLSVF
jgi:hypothetical protein